jgi:putative tricarboxylic transport membrane protein
MRLNDTLAGLLLACVGLAVALHAWSFPALPAQRIGPSVFPVTIGVVLALIGAALVVEGRQRPGVPPVTLDEWVRRPRLLFTFALVIAALVVYALTVDRVGFFIAAFVFLSILMLAFGVRRTWIAPLAASVTLGIHYVFYSLLRVPLPWGLFEGVAW